MDAKFEEVQMSQCPRQTIGRILKPKWELVPWFSYNHVRKEAHGFVLEVLR